jgi:hypothetical protein
VIDVIHNVVGSQNGASRNISQRDVKNGAAASAARQIEHMRLQSRGGKRDEETFAQHFLNARSNTCFDSIKKALAFLGELLRPLNVDIENN